MRWGAVSFVFVCAPISSAAETCRRWQQSRHALDGTGFDNETPRPLGESRSVDRSANPKATALSRCQMKCVPTLQGPQSGASNIRKTNAAEKIVPAVTSSQGVEPRPASGTAKATPKVAINPGA